MRALAHPPQVGPHDRVAIRGLPPKPGQQLTLEGTRPDGSTYSFPVNHTFNENQARAGRSVSPRSGGEGAAMPG